MHLRERNDIHNKLTPPFRVSAYKQRLTDNCIMHHVMSVITRDCVAISAAPLSREKRQGLPVQSHSTASVILSTSRDLQPPCYRGSEPPLCESSLDACCMLQAPSTSWIRQWINILPNRRYLHLDEVTLYRVIGLAYLEGLKCYAGGSVATGRVSLAGQDEGERSDEEWYPGTPGWGLRHWTSTPTLAKMFPS